MAKSISVKVSEATGNARRFIYSKWKCGGYNPCDSLFWRSMERNPPSDESWEFVLASLVKEFGEVVEIPEDILAMKIRVK